MIRMASVEQALALIASMAALAVACLETIPLADKAEGRVLAEPVVAAVSQPPADVSAMDGYAVRFADMQVGARLQSHWRIARRRHPFGGSVDAGEAVRIFTGAHVPAGADHILIQEDAKRGGDMVEVSGDTDCARLHPPQGTGLRAGDELVPAGHGITAGAIALVAAGNVADVEVRVAPRIGVLANGDELVAPGSATRVRRKSSTRSRRRFDALIRQLGRQRRSISAVARDD